MNFIYSRRIRFPDTDAAGVVYFANYLSICHEAYEEALLQAGIELHDFFGEAGIVIPIAHAHCDFLRPLRCGDSIEVEVTAEQTKENTFSLHHKIYIVATARKLAATARTDHVCIDAASRKRSPLPSKLSEWISPTGQ